MPRHRHVYPMFRYCRHEDSVIVLAVRWYISYRLNLRDLVEMLAERGLDISPSTIWRWVQRFVPEFERRWDRLRKPIGCSWRVDETYVPDPWPLVLSLSRGRQAGSHRRFLVAT
ncbi:MAG TPA: hypothetical protein VGN07_23390 [Steroidobacteraceae bacterium]|jgi:transposase-like protein